MNKHSVDADQPQPGGPTYAEMITFLTERGNEYHELARAKWAQAAHPQGNPLLAELARDEAREIESLRDSAYALRELLRRNQALFDEDRRD